jgi:hypothetical protein
VASLLGHLVLDTTRGYTAVFSEALIGRHQQFIALRRSLRESVEYCDVSTQKWGEFAQNFMLRRVELGDCFHPYGGVRSEQMALFVVGRPIEAPVSVHFVRSQSTAGLSLGEQVKNLDYGFLIQARRLAFVLERRRRDPVPPPTVPHVHHVGLELRFFVPFEAAGQPRIHGEVLHDLTHVVG